jgi:hypothetical protein
MKEILMDTWHAIVGALVVGMALAGLTKVISVGEQLLIEKEEAKEFLELVDDKTLQRDMSPEEFKVYGHDATGGVIFGNANEEVRLHCIQYFDGTSAAFVDHSRLPKERVDREYCKYAQLD